MIEEPRLWLEPVVQALVSLSWDEARGWNITVSERRRHDPTWCGRLPYERLCTDEALDVVSVLLYELTGLLPQR